MQEHQGQKWLEEIWGKLGEKISKIDMEEEVEDVEALVLKRSSPSLLIFIHKGQEFGQMKEWGRMKEAGFWQNTSCREEKKLLQWKDPDCGEVKAAVVERSGLQWEDPSRL
ncbi:hypothetical protein HD554DRAFT_2037689 [Boletus coccyginus]|nr:hypothetical protein HD554DRAFT_2037689 [Boletus coccyginus]